VTHVEGEVNPIRDLDIINEELRLKDEEYLNSHLEKLERTVLRGGDKKLKPEYVSSHLKGGGGPSIWRLMLRF
jgi:obg-like ATPase 1